MKWKNENERIENKYEEERIVFHISLRIDRSIPLCPIFNMRSISFVLDLYGFFSLLLRLFFLLLLAFNIFSISFHVFSSFFYMTQGNDWIWHGEQYTVHTLCIAKVKMIVLVPFCIVLSSFICCFWFCCFGSPVTTLRFIVNFYFYFWKWQKYYQIVCSRTTITNAVKGIHHPEILL